MNTQKFWTWFQQNEKSYHELNNAEPNDFLEKIKEFKKQFNRMDTSIPYEIIIPGNLKKQGTITLYAYGNKNLYQKIYEIVNAAPKLKYWTINAFIQPKKRFKPDKDYSLEGFGISLDKLFFQPIRFYKTTKMVNLVFYTNQYVFGEDSSELKFYLIRLLSYYLGEEYVFNKVKNLKLLKCKQNKDKIYPAIHIKEFLKNPTPNNLPKKSYKRVPKQKPQNLSP